MTSEAPSSTPPRANTLTVALVAGLIAFMLGLVVMAAIFRFGDWWKPAPPPVQPQAAAADPRPALPPGTDIATLAAREQALAARLDALDMRIRTSDTDARTAGSAAGRAEAMLLVSSARRAIERGQELGSVEGELRARFTPVEPQAVATIVRAASEPVTLEDLRFALEQIAPRLSTAAPGAGWWDAMRREIGSLVIVRKESSPSSHPRERLTRARRLLAQGHVEASLAEINRLPGAQGAESWMAAASRYIAARRALDTLEAAAVAGRVQPPTGAPPPAAQDAAE
ncbi:hypothetical protein M9978_14330 [Sphingomonas sp. MG17]|uniref:Inner membrane protein n=1 Tax=Sphingomonas tagetis TaxID=2949092 RepID=A0A9X2HNG7_9SPHN|nr:hypothetical protein [Sphingomonas tagetis]MCP3731601.1 hypothetical protein [Sphingomonas tagetis]